VLVHAAARQQDVPLVFGQEWQPLAPATLLFGYASFLFIWVAFSLAFLVGEAARRPLPAEKRSLLWSSFLLGALFLALTMLNTRRGMTLWAAFSVFFVAGAFDALLLPELRQRGPGHRLLRALALVVFAAFLFRAVNVADEMVFRPKWLGSAPDRARVAAVWLRENTPAGSTVLNVNWWDFPELFFWNTHNRYVGGLDPIFQYAHDPALYWKVHHLELGDALPLTCGDEVCSPDNSEDIPTVVQRDFDAEFLVVDSEINLDLYNYLRSADEFEFCVEDQKMAVFRRIPTPSPPPHRSPSPAPVSTQE
jgi:hypothetical protein